MDRQFQLLVTDVPSLKSYKDIKTVATLFLEQTGIIGNGYWPKTTHNGRRDGKTPESIHDSVPFRMFVDCFLMNPKTFYSIADLEHELNTTRFTIYRHLNKFKNLDLLEQHPTEDGKKGYRLKYGSIAQAWGFVKVHIERAMQTYDANVQYLEELAQNKTSIVRKILD